MFSPLLGVKRSGKKVSSVFIGNRSYLHAIYYDDGTVGRKGNNGKRTWRKTLFGLGNYDTRA